MSASDPLAESAAPPSAADLRLLDDPIWNSLRIEHAHLALANARARRYPPAIGPLSGIADTSAASYEALRELTAPNGVAVLFLASKYEPQSGWTLVRDGQLLQMICPEPIAATPESFAPGAQIIPLTAADNREMIELAHLTEPGPFFDRTAELGTFFGIRLDGRLAAMAGERTRFPRFVEVSAVCTHPDARGRGYGKALTATVARHIRAGGKTPILHLFAANKPALSVYQSLGFQVRHSLELAVLRNTGNGDSIHE